MEGGDDVSALSFAVVASGSQKVPQVVLKRR